MEINSSICRSTAVVECKKTLMQSSPNHNPKQEPATELSHAPDVVVFAPAPDPLSGGSVVLHALARELLAYGFSVRIGCFPKPYAPDSVFGPAATSRDIGPGTIVIYPEVISGNPLGARHVIRWILCQVGRHCSADTPETWGADDLVYHYSTFDPFLPSDRVALLTIQTIDPRFALGRIAAKNGKRHGACVMIRKAYRFHGTKLPIIHPPDAVLLPETASLDQLLEAFTKFDLLYCYDPYTFHIIHAALAGCVPIVVPFAGISKRQWLRSLAVSPYLAEHGLNNLAGIAWGIDDLPYAKATLEKVADEQAAIADFNCRTVGLFADNLRQIHNGEPLDRYIPTVKDFFPRRTILRRIFSRMRLLAGRLGLGH